MTTDIEELFFRIGKVSLEGISSVCMDKNADTGKEEIGIDFLRLKGAIRNDKSHLFKMAVRMDYLYANARCIRFIVPDIEKCEAKSIDHSIYLDANHRIEFGGHKWNFRDKTISFGFSLPLPNDSGDIPNIELLHHILKNIYEGLLFPDVVRSRWSISENDLFSPDEKNNKINQLNDVVSRLASLKFTTDEEIV